MDLIPLDKDTPEDIINTISDYIDPKNRTLLDKKNRDKYFSRYGISIDCKHMGKYQIRDSIEFLEKYDITILKYISYTLFEGIEDIVFKNTKEIKNTNIIKLSGILDKFKNIKKISGTITGTYDNLRDIKKLNIENDLIIMMYKRKQLNLYTELGLTNMISMHIILTFDELFKIKDKVYATNSGLLHKDLILPKLECLSVTDYSLSQVNLPLPNLKIIYIYIMKNIIDEVLYIIGSYPNSQIIIADYCIDGYNMYRAIADLPVKFLLRNNSTYEIINCYEKRLVTEEPIHLTKSLITDGVCTWRSPITKN